MRAAVRESVTDADRPLVLSFTGVTRFVPLLVCGGFVLATVLLLLVGPLDWHLESPVRVYGFLAAAMGALVAGYLAATLRQRSKDATDGAAYRPRFDASALVIIGGTVFLVLYLPTVHATTGKWYPDVWAGLTDTGAAYATSKDLAESGPKLVLYLRMLVAPLTIVLLPLTLYFWPRLSLAARWVGGACALLGLVLTMAQGINRGVAELCANVVLFLVLVATAALARRDWSRVAKCAFGSVLIIGLFAAYYSTTIGNRVAADFARDNRYADSAKDRADQLRKTAELSTATEREDSPYFFLLPAPAEPMGVVLDSYLTHGYRGLDLAMQEPFEPTWGLGFSEFARHNITKVVGGPELEETIDDRTYAGQIDKRWPVGQLWATFYIHPASDIGFPGTVLLMGLIGFLFGLSWRDTLVRRDPLACTVFFYLCIAVIYLPANNQLYQGGELAIGFTALTLAWLVLRRRTHTRST